MPWNEPGNNSNNNPQDPWGGKRDSKSPPDLDKILGDFIKKLQGFFKSGSGGGGGSQNNRSWQPTFPKNYGYAIGLVALVILVIWVVSGFFIVNPAEQAVVLRLGKYNDVEQPGLHWMARFIDTRYLVDVQKIYSFSLEGDFLTKSSEQGDLPNQVQVASTQKAAEAADQSKNLVNVELNVQYRVSDPRAYLFNVVDPDSTMQQAASGALSDVIGQMKLDEVLTTGREMVSSGVFERVKKILANYNAGLEVIGVTLRKIQAPDQVRAAFSDVNRADQDRSTTIQQAQAYASKVVPLAQGLAARILADANGYRQQIVLKSQADVARYQAMLQAYQASPDLTRERLYLDSIQNILKNTSKVLIDTNSGNNLLYLPLDKLIQNSYKSIPQDANTMSSASNAITTHDESTTNSSSSETEVKNESN
jgi:membrane protease subunit HflK